MNHGYSLFLPKNFPHLLDDIIVNRMPTISNRFAKIKPSAIRQAQIEFSKRDDSVEAINVAVGNVQLPMHPAMQERMFHLDSSASPFRDGVVGYTETVGTKESNAAVRRILEASILETSNIYTHITSGGSEAMEFMIMGIGERGRPLLVIDPIYSNYQSIAQRVGVSLVSLPRELNDDGTFTSIHPDLIEELILKHHPCGLLVIPYDNPTGTIMSKEILVALARLCVKYDMWLVSDEAYRELYYGDTSLVSIWQISEQDTPGISGHRISIESASKVWNACGIRIGAIVTDNEYFHTQAVAEHTSNLCASAIGQYIFGAIAEESVDDIRSWFAKQKNYYRGLIKNTVKDIQLHIPNSIVTPPESALYSVVDVRKIVDEHFSALDFCIYCAQTGKVEIDNTWYTLLMAPMSGFYTPGIYSHDPGRTQMRIAYVQEEKLIAKVPLLLEKLLGSYTSHKK